MNPGNEDRISNDSSNDDGVSMYCISDLSEHIIAAYINTELSNKATVVSRNNAFIVYMKVSGGVADTLSEYYPFDEHVMNMWNGKVSDFAQMCLDLRSNIDTVFGIKPSVEFHYLNDRNADRALLSIRNGVVLYDITDELIC